MGSRFFREEVCVGSWGWGRQVAWRGKAGSGYCQLQAQEAAHDTTWD